VALGVPANRLWLLPWRTIVCRNRECHRLLGCVPSVCVQVVG
jgi:hypothetical protein